MGDKVRRYAQDTKVSVGQSKHELETLLRKAGAGQMMMGSDQARDMILVAFSIEGRQVRIRATTARPSRRCASEQLEREAWRALVLICKAKLEYIAMGHSTVEREFLAEIVLPDGSTVADDVLPKLAEAYTTGSMPRLLPA